MVHNFTEKGNSSLISFQHEIKRKDFICSTIQRWKILKNVFAFYLRRHSAVCKIEKSWIMFSDFVWENIEQCARLKNLEKCFRILFEKAFSSVQDWKILKNVFAFYLRRHSAVCKIEMLNSVTEFAAQRGVEACSLIWG